MQFVNVYRVTGMGLVLFAALSGLGAGPVANAGIIYSDDFSGGTGDLNGLAPDVRTGTDGSSSSATWLAFENTNADGSILSTPFKNSTATLAFTPVAGRIYSLSADLNNTTTHVDWKLTDWLALGFAESISNSGFSFSTGNDGFAWMTLLGNRGTNQGTWYAGPSAAGGVTFDTPAGVVNYKIVLNTMQEDWSVSWYVNNALISSHMYDTPPAIGAVGFSKIANGRGVVDSFVLSVIPEPGTVILIAAALPFLLRRRRA